MDNTANFLSALQNAQKRQKNLFVFPFSLQIYKLLNILYIEGYIKGFKLISSSKINSDIDSLQKTKIEIHLKSLKNTENLQFTFDIKKLSKQSKRIYVPWKHLNKIKRGLGSLLLSTSKGVFIDRDARYLKIGGEPLCLLS